MIRRLTSCLAWVAGRVCRHRPVPRSLSPLFHALDEGLCLLDLQGRLRVVNRPFAAFFSTTPEALAGQEMIPLLRGHGLGHLVQPFEQLLRPPWESHGVELTLPFDGHTRHMLVSLTPLEQDRFGTWLMLTFKDISQVVRSKRAVAWASMARKLAHEIKTPLSTIMLSAQRLQSDASDRQAKYLAHIIGQVNRLRDLTDGLLKFARIEHPVPSPTDVNALVQEVLEGFRRSLGPDVVLETLLAEQLPPIRADQAQMRIALGNLISNAVNAMSGQGTLSLATRRTQDGKAVEIEIGDTGRGIPPQAMNRLFEPFYSQSPGGTGLGLVIVKTIIEDHRGRMDIHSQEGQGTTVVLALPLDNSTEGHP